MDWDDFIVIDDGNLEIQDSTLDYLRNWRLQTSRMYMTKADYDDIIKWSNGSP